VNYAWGIGLHGQKQGGVILPDMLRWLWRDQTVSTDPNDTVERSFREAVKTDDSTAEAATPKS
jgi:enterochelin esterase family protein